MLARLAAANKTCKSEIKLLKLISVLYTRTNSIYHKMGLDCWDITRDARKWPGGNSIIAHPPCRGWGNFSHKAKCREGEKELAVHALTMVRIWGGVVEHPKTSKLWKLLNLPLPGEIDKYQGWTLNIDQKEFGHRAKKNTFLYIKGCKPKDIPPIPLTLKKHTCTIEKMSRKEREETPLKFAIWLKQLAEICNKNLHGALYLNMWTQKPENKSPRQMQSTIIQ